MNYEKLQMTADKSEGSFVRDLQGETGVGFAKNTHVHKDWYATTISYDDALDLAYDAARDREDLLAPVKNIQGSVNSDGQFVFKVGDREFVPTDHAIEQFAIRAGVPSSSVMRELRKQEDYDAQDADVMTYLANNALRRLNQDKEYRLRTYTDGTCRAFVTDKYAPVDNRWYLETLQSFLPDGRLSHWKGDEDTIYGNILLPDTILDYGTDDDSDYGGMLSIGNSEIGMRRISSTPSVFRAICMNGCIWDQEKGKSIGQVHRGSIDLEALKYDIQHNLNQQVPLMNNGIDLLLKLREFGSNGVPMSKIVGQVCSDYKVTKKHSYGVLKAFLVEKSEVEELSKSAFGVANAFTRFGQTLDDSSWVKFDEIGGKIANITESKWNSTIERAKSLDEKDLDKVFGSIAA